MLNPADLAELMHARACDPSGCRVPSWLLNAPLGPGICRASATCRQCRRKAVLVAPTIKALDDALAGWRCPSDGGPAF